MTVFDVHVIQFTWIWFSSPFTIMLLAVSISLDFPYFYQVLGVECRVSYMLSMYVALLLCYSHNFIFNKKLVFVTFYLFIEDCPEILYVAQVGLELPRIHLLGLRACTTTTSLYLLPSRKVYAYYIN